MGNFACMQDLIDLSKKEKRTIAELIIEHEALSTRKSVLSIKERMDEIWQVMKESAKKGIESKAKSVSGMVGGDACKLFAYEHCFCGEFMKNAASFAIAVAETNAVMGKIAACPTAGSCGIVPGTLIAAQRKYKYTDEEIKRALFTATGIGMVIENNAMIAGAQGGCQAECGAAAAMAAGALADLAGGDAEQIANAVALSLKNLLGLACDPVAGLVEVPCVKRNGMVTAIAILGADMSMAGIKSVIPADEVIDAMYRIGKSLPKSIRETAGGGLATSPTGLKLKHKIYGE